jgi:sugar phosphate isomerase/epimerase
MFELGLSTPGYVNEQLFIECKETGIKHLEISVDKWKSEQLDFAQLKAWSEKYNVNLWSFHLPFWPFDEIDISNKELAEKSINYLSEFIKKGSEIGIKKYVIHASGEPIAEEDRKSRMECAKKSLYTLAEFAKGYGSVILVEDLPRTCLGRNSGDMMELLSAHPDLRACFDTNHLLDEDIVKFIHVLRDKIVSTHISDYDFNNERHWLPGEGDINWQELIRALKDVNYQGIWLYEIDFGCPPTIKRDRDLTCKDFADNIKELALGNTPSPLGTRACGLKHWTK